MYDQGSAVFEYDFDGDPAVEAAVALHARLVEELIESLVGDRP